MLFLIIEAFNKPNAYMGADNIIAVDMGDIFEDLVRRFLKVTMNKLGLISLQGISFI
ncbi:MAG: hypothetical protein V8S33_03695 [Intestinibacter bartlettii]